MSYITIGSLITSIIKEQKVERKSLVKGICSTQTLSAIEKDQGKSDPFMIEVLLQRMGKSPDKLEQILL